MLGLCSSIVETTCKIDVSLMTRLLVHQWPVTGPGTILFSNLIPAFLEMDCQSSQECNAEFFNNMSPKKKTTRFPPEKVGMRGWWRFLNWEEKGIVSQSFTELKEL
jgi:hypothetical protein